MEEETVRWRKVRALYRRMASVEEVVEALGLHGRDVESAEVSKGLSLSCSPLSPLVQSLESQKHLLDYVLHDPISTRFPPSAKYSARLLKALLDLLSRDEVLEDLLSLYFDLSSSNPLSDGSMRSVIHKTWSLMPPSASILAEKETTLTIRMADQLDSVGLTSWQAGFMLADFISANTDLFANRRTLELGSGVGLTGIVLAKLARSERLCLTDYTPEVLTNMRTNAAINDLPNLEIVQLDWEQFDSDSVDRDSLLPFIPDVLLAADCVYDLDLVKCLCIVLRWVLSKPTEPKPVAFIATTLRNPKTFQFFMEQLKLNGLHHEDVTSFSKFDNLFDQKHEGIILSKITFPT